jgi:chemotaxis response regulator CheB
MTTKVLLADDNKIMRECVGRLLRDQPSIELVGIAASFAQAMQMRVDFKPEVLVFDLHLAQKQDFTPAFVKSQMASISVIAISTFNDEEAQALAASYGALILLDKMTLFNELIPTIAKCCPNLAAQGAEPAPTNPLATAS